MQFNPETIDSTLTYKLLSGVIVPRPIGWISTVGPDGVNNLAPYSFFNAVSGDPPHVLFCSGKRSGNHKDSAGNALATGEFVVNLVSESTAEAMNITATELPADVDEFAYAGLTALSSVLVAAPRVGESLVNLECKVVHSYEIEGGGSVIVVGRVVMMHVADKILDERNRINYAAYKPVGRLAGSGYCRVNDLFEMERPASRL
ncbi:MAG: flavin reductase family protein [Caldilineaceae bacterium]|nr:flavin reductase family protein [Caldilineaceae bacterium]